MRPYTRTRPDQPGRAERTAMAARGLRWCRGCQDWLPSADVTRQGACRPCINAEYRARYAEAPDAIRGRVQERKRGVAAVPPDAAELLLDHFHGRCAYCPALPTTWDHVVPVSQGGLTEPGNIVPACGSCNSSKGTKDVLVWLAHLERVPSDDLLSVLALAAMAA